MQTLGYDAWPLRCCALAAGYPQVTELLCCQDETAKASKPLFGLIGGTRKVRAGSSPPAAPQPRKARSGTQKLRGGTGTDDDGPPKPRGGLFGLGGVPAMYGRVIA